MEGCQKVARGRTSFCAAHGGGIRCKVSGCNKAAVGKFQMCRTHSGYPKKRASEQQEGEGGGRTGGRTTGSRQVR